MISYIVLFFALFKLASNHELISTESVDLNQENEKILAAIDDIFITLKVDKNLRMFKNVAEYILIHNYIQDAVENRNKRYNEMYNLSKITPDHKTAYYISNINNALREMINEYKVTKTNLFFANNKHTTPVASDDIMNDFVSLARQFRLNLNINRNNKADKDYDIAKKVETRRVFGGQPVEIRDWPFVVSILIAGKFACAGSIVREDLVLSAASCYKRFYKKKLKREFNSNIWIRAGSDFFNSGGVMVRGVMLHFHSKYKPEELIHNIVVLQLKLKLRYKRRLIQPVRYARKRRPYKRVEIVGWGNKEYETSSVPDSPEFVRMTEEPSILRRDNRRGFGGEDMFIEDRQLQHSVLGKYSMKDCRNVYLNHTINSRNFCAGYEYQGSGACKYDIGGPGVIGELLQGVISFGPSRCGIRNSPTVFTKVYRYARWLDKVFCKIPITNDTVDDSGEMEGLAVLGPGGRKDRKYPFVASVFVKNKFVCTGAIIRRELVITVASCLEPFNFLEPEFINRRRFTFNTNVYVRVGSDLYPTGTLIPVIKFHFHYNFDYKTLAFNLVILVLRRKIDFVPGEVSGIHVSNATRLKFKYRQVPVVGWGAECPASKKAPRKEPALLLRSVMLNRITYRDCRKNYTLNNNTDFYVSRLHHCVLTHDWGADSLGNLVLVKNRLFGLVSVDCSRRTPDSPTVFIKTAVFSWWINNIMCRYKERYDPSDLSKVSDYGSIENVSSAEMVVIHGRKIHCHDDTDAALNCTSINITTYYCERLNGEPLKHGTPISCADIDRYTKVNCTEGNVSEIDREDVSRSVVNWPHGSTHNGSIYNCVIGHRNSSVRGCNYTTGGALICHETNCTENVDEDIIYCNYRTCRKNKKECIFQKRYCLDLGGRPIDCPPSFRKCWTYWNDNFCKFKKCTQKKIDQFVWKQKSMRECYYQFHCYDKLFEGFRNCSNYHHKICTTINDVPVCAKRYCTYITNKARHTYCYGHWQRAYCLDKSRDRIACPEYKMPNDWTKCSYLEQYIYNEAFICTEYLCTIAHLLDIEGHNYCRARNYCYMTVDQVNKTIDCPINGENCRKVNVDEYEYAFLSKFQTSTYKMICVQSNCTSKYGIVANCTSTSSYYCHNDDIYVDCPPLNMVGLSGPTTIYPRSGRRTRPDYGVDDNFYQDGDLKFTTYASPIQIQTELIELKTPNGVDDNADDDPYGGNDMKLITSASPIQIQNNAPILRARTDVDNYADDDPDNDNNMESTIYGSPIQIQNNKPTFRTQADLDNYADDDSDNDNNMEFATNASPIQIQNNAPTFKARAHVDDYADNDLDNENEIELTTYATPRQLQTNVPAIIAQLDNADANDDPDRNNDLESTTYASPIQIESSAPIFRARADVVDYADDYLDNGNVIELTTYASPRQIQSNVPTFRTQSDFNNFAVDESDNDNDLQLTRYTSPREIQTNAPALRPRASDDHTDDNPTKNWIGLTTYANIRENPTNVGALRAQADDGYYAADVPVADDDGVMDEYEEKDISGYTVKKGEED